MDLLDLMTNGGAQRERALDRLQSLVALYRSDAEAEQREALERAMAFAERELDSYHDGILALAERADGAEAEALRAEAEHPGTIIRALRMLREEDYGRKLITLPTPFEQTFIQAAEGVAADGLPWAVAQAYPLPRTVEAARAETLLWDGRKAEIAEALGEVPDSELLPAACLARQQVVESLWRRDLHARTLADVAARLAYWAERHGGEGYHVLLADITRLMESGVRGAGESTKEKARRLKADHPDWSLARIGKELGISRQAVHKHLKS